MSQRATTSYESPQADASGSVLEMRKQAADNAEFLRDCLAEQKRTVTKLPSIQEHAEPHPAAPGGPANPMDRPKHSVWRQILRLDELITWFNLCCAFIHTLQWLVVPLYFINKKWFYRGMDYTRQQFGILIITVTQWFSPTVVRVSGDSSVQHQIIRTSDGRLETRFPERMIFLANHQIYTEWLYLWWIAYTSNMHGAIYIILKDVLQWIPALGPGMKFFGFIFLARNWTKDKARLLYRLQKLKQPQRYPGQKPPKLDPMWLLIFPEGTNLSANTRKRSAAYAAKENIQDLEHLLLPRSTGLLYCLRELKGTIDWVYDCTMAYEGVPRGGYAQDLFTLRSVFLQGRPPKSVNMYWRRINVRDIPIEDDVAFGQWLMYQWLKKESLIEHYVQHGRFPAMPRGKGHIETEVKLASALEISQIFVASVVAMLLGLFVVISKT
ncbi:uncharacterized protein KY384_003881 [Bacidia gigantensis]|uniref:uncharacterized protein n=1 Tax=Bacidia gigantensis TaxID=2732470 RepID=UPI001D03755E|nr:uncharacterized protein KY384_003881 [Bacidia gigantensis]KAG8532240.1 hypothetical protein KY384_003881 [Bacidia gigantensis]